MAELYFLVGLPGSGKSTYAAILERDKNCIVHSSDKIREEFGDVNDQTKNVKVFETLHKRVKNDLQNDKDTVYDSTNLKRKRRVEFLKELKNIPCKKICVLVATPWEYCLAQNFARERQVPEDVMCNMYKGFQMPSLYEGFDEVVLYYAKEEWKTYYGNVVDYVRSLIDYSQDNHHHALKLGEHMYAAANYILDQNMDDDLAYAALTHDIGKPDTKTFKDSKGRTTEEAHYYNHHCVGSYKSLFFKYPSYIKSKEYIALLIELHMKPYMEWQQSEKARQKDLRIFGQDVIRDVKLLHEADRNAH